VRLLLASSLLVLLFPRAVGAQTISNPSDQQGVSPSDQQGANADGAAAGDRKPAFTFTPNAGLQGTFTDNARLVSKGEQSDWISTVTGGLDVSGQTERTQLAGTYSVSGDFYARNSNLDGYRQNLVTLDRFEPVKGKFLIDLRAAIDQDQIALTGPQAATTRSGLTNQTQVANASITPSYVEKLGNWSVSTLSYSLNRVSYFDAANSSTASNLNDSTQQRLAATLVSGSLFSLLNWDLDLSDDISRGTDTHLDQRTAEADAEYRINSTFRLPVSVGYDSFSENQLGLSSSSLSGPFWDSGIHLVPGPRTDLVLRYGHRYGEPYESGSLAYKILPNVQFTAVYDITVQTQQQTLANALQGATVDASGSIVNPISGLATNPNQVSTNLVNSVFRSRTFQFGVSGTHGQNFFSLAGNSVARSFGGIQGDDRSEGANATVGRNLGPLTALSLNVQADHTVTTNSATASDLGSSFSLLTGVNLAYKLSEQTNLSFDATRRHQTGTSAADEDAFVVRIGHKF